MKTTLKKLFCGTLAALSAALMIPSAVFADEADVNTAVYQVSHKRTSNVLDIAPIVTDTHFVVHSDASTGRDTLYDMDGYRVFTADSGDVISDVSNRYVACEKIIYDSDGLVNINAQNAYAYEIGKWDEKIGPYNSIEITDDGEYLIVTDSYGTHLMSGNSTIKNFGTESNIYSAGNGYLGMISDNGSSLYNINTDKTISLPNGIMYVTSLEGSSVGIGITEDFQWRLIGTDGKNISSDYSMMLPLNNGYFVGITDIDGSYDSDTFLPDADNIIYFKADMINSKGMVVNSFNSQMPLNVFGEYILLANPDDSFTLYDPKFDRIIVLGDWVMKLADGSLVITDSENGKEGNYGSLYSADGKFIENVPVPFYNKDASGKIEVGKDPVSGKFTLTCDGVTKTFDAERLLATDNSALIQFAGDSEEDSSTGVLNRTGEDYLVPARKGNALVPINLLNSLSLSDNFSVDTLYHTFENGNLLYVIADADGTTGYYIITDDSIPFYDVEKSDWFYDAINYSFGNSLMRGTTPTIFEPNTQMTRAMLVTVLHRLEGEPAPSGTYFLEFNDIDSDSWYSNALKWAAENGIVNGTTATTFEPNAPVTREQIATMMYRYVHDNKKEDVSAKADLSSFPDAADTADWARDALEWANAAGLISGKREPDGSVILAPAAKTTRAEVSTIMMRYGK